MCPSVLPITVFLVKFRKRLWVKKDCGGSLKSNSMFTNILPSLDRVPLKSIPKWFSHKAIISQTCGAAKKSCVGQLGCYISMLMVPK